MKAIIIRKGSNMRGEGGGKGSNMRGERGGQKSLLFRTAFCTRNLHFYSTKIFRSNL